MWMVAPFPVCLLLTGEGVVGGRQGCMWCMSGWRGGREEVDEVKEERNK